MSRWNIKSVKCQADFGMSDDDQFSFEASYSSKKVAGKLSRHWNCFVIHVLDHVDVDPSHLLLLIEPVLIDMYYID